MSTSNAAYSEPKFTRGEKCIFSHLVVTFLIITVLLIVFFTHLYVVTHSLRDALTVSRRRYHRRDMMTTDYTPVGAIFLSSAPTQVICNTLLLRPRWSLSAGHCTAIRSDPDLSHILREWRIKYINHDSNFLESEIERSIPHPHFNRDDYRNNVGVFGHKEPINVYQYEFANNVAISTIMEEVDQTMVIIGWVGKNGNPKSQDRLQLKLSAVQPVAIESCARLIAPIVDLRKYEFCVLLGKHNDTVLDHGALFVMGSRVIGLFAWGEKTGVGVPLIILNILDFKEWIEDIISL